MINRYAATVPTLALEHVQSLEAKADQRTGLKRFERDEYGALRLVPAMRKVPPFVPPKRTSSKPRLACRWANVPACEVIAENQPGKDWAMHHHWCSQRPSVNAMVLVAHEAELDLANKANDELAQRERDRAEEYIARHLSAWPVCVNGGAVTIAWKRRTKAHDPEAYFTCSCQEVPRG